MGRRHARKRARTAGGAAPSKASGAGAEIDAYADVDVRNVTEEAGGSAIATDVDVSALESLPAELQQACMGFLGAEDALPLRGVSRRLRATFESTAWDSLTVTARRAAYVKGVAGLVKRWKLRLQPRASCTIKLVVSSAGRKLDGQLALQDDGAGSGSGSEFEQVEATEISDGDDDPFGEKLPHKPRRERRQLHRACALLLKACSQAASGLREATIIAAEAENGSPEELFMAALEGLGCMPRGAKTWHSLESFRFLSSGRPTRNASGRSWEAPLGLYDPEDFYRLGAPPLELKLEGALAPLAGLRALELSGDFLLCPPGAAAIVKALPQLRRLVLSTQGHAFANRRNGLDACRHLATLEHLEEASVYIEVDHRENMYGEVIASAVAAAFADGPAGRSLRALRIDGGVFTGAGLRALARMTSLESLGGVKWGPACEAEDFAALGALPRLRELQLEFSRRISFLSEQQLPVAHCLSPLLAASSSLHSLDLTVECGHGKAGPAEVAAALAAAAGVLTSFTLISTCGEVDHMDGEAFAVLCSRGRPLSEAEALALAACGQLRRLRLRVGAGEPEAYRALAPLRRLGRELEVRLALEAGMEDERSGDPDGSDSDACPPPAPLAAGEHGWHRFLRDLFPAARVQFVY
eukprot:tig00000246_g21496.t1